MSDNLNVLHDKRLTHEELERKKTNVGGKKGKIYTQYILDTRQISYQARPLRLHVRNDNNGGEQRYKEQKVNSENG